jgi:hypothetical protein
LRRVIFWLVALVVVGANIGDDGAYSCTAVAERYVSLTTPHVDLEHPQSETPLTDLDGLLDTL